MRRVERLDVADGGGEQVVELGQPQRLARVEDDRLKIFRRPYNYDETPSADGTADAGLVFASYQRDIAEQFLPIQRRLAEADLLNDWITPIGSAVFAIPPGCQRGGWIGETLLG
jgi:dye decolorizing peroxidase